MKKFLYLAIVAILAAGVTGCNKEKSSKAGLADEMDSLSYAMGMQQAQGLNQYLMQMGLDSNYVSDFYRGLKKGYNDGGDKKKEAYYMGIAIGQQVANRMIKGINEQLFEGDSTQSINEKAFYKGFLASAKELPTAMTMDDATAYAQSKFQEIRSKSIEKTYGENKKAGENFLAANKKKPGVKVLPSGVQYKVLKEGTGETVADSVTVEVNYEGRTIDGKVFDSTYERGRTQTMTARGTIPGFAEVLTRMPIGSTWEVYIPQDKAYGERNMGNIKPFSALIFKLELVGKKQK